MNNGKECGCSGSKMVDRTKECCRAESKTTSEKIEGKSELRQWPVQLHLVSPKAPYFKDADIVLAADCVSYAMGNFHEKYLKGKSLAIACPKLDNGQEIYTEKIKTLIEESNINTLTVVIMEVPCCMGLLNLAKAAYESTSKKIPFKAVIVSINGDVLKENWI